MGSNVFPLPARSIVARASSSCLFCDIQELPKLCLTVQKTSVDWWIGKHQVGYQEGVILTQVPGTQRDLSLGDHRIASLLSPGPDWPTLASNEARSQEGKCCHNAMIICQRLIKQACRRSTTLLAKPSSIGEAQQTYCVAAHIKEPPPSPICLTAMGRAKKAARKTYPGLRGTGSPDRDATKQVEALSDVGTVSIKRRWPAVSFIRCSMQYHVAGRQSISCMGLQH